MTIDLNRRHLLLSGAGLTLAGCAANGIAPAEAARLFPSTQAAMDRHVAAGHVPGISVGVRMPDGQDVFLQAGSLDGPQGRWSCRSRRSCWRTRG